MFQRRRGKRRPSERRCIVLTTAKTTTKTTTMRNRRPSRQGGKFILRGVISTCVMRCAFSRRWKFLTFFGHRNIPTAVDDAWHRGFPQAFQHSAGGLSIIDASSPHFPVLLAPAISLRSLHNTLCHPPGDSSFFFSLLLNPGFPSFAVGAYGCVRFSEASPILALFRDSRVRGALHELFARWEEDSRLLKRLINKLHNFPAIPPPPSLKIILHAGNLNLNANRGLARQVMNWERYFLPEDIARCRLYRTEMQNRDAASCARIDFPDPGDHVPLPPSDTSWKVYNAPPPLRPTVYIRLLVRIGVALLYNTAVSHDTPRMTARSIDKHCYRIYERANVLIYLTRFIPILCLILVHIFPCVLKVQKGRILHTIWKIIKYPDKSLMS